MIVSTCDCSQKVLRVCGWISHMYQHLSLDMGDLFSVRNLRCVNYTAEFDWSIDTGIADTQLQLSCHNSTNVGCGEAPPCNFFNCYNISKELGVDEFLLYFQEFNPDIPVRIRLEKSESHWISLTGNVECVLSGCYEDREYSERRLIPNITFSCRPAISSMYILTPLFVYTYIQCANNENCP